MVACKVLVLDGEEHTFEVSKSSKVQELFDAVCQKLELVENEYFGLTLEDKKNGKVWLNNSKKIGKYMANGPAIFSLEVKFYPPNPNMLQNELTRYQLFLQLRRDILSEKLPCSFLTLALLGSHAVQSELGDYDPAVNGKDFQYLRNVSLAPKQTQELLEKIAELHIMHRGQSPGESEQEYLSNAKKLSLYGIHMHNAKDVDNEDVQIGVCAAGLLVFKHRLRIHRFVWAKIIKILYKRNIFTIRVRPAEHERQESTLAYKLPSLLLAKRLWKLAVEHHAFFRLKESDPASRSNFPHFTSKHRFSGRTQLQASRNGAASQPGNIRRGGQFSKSVEGLAGFTTERAEQYQEDNRPHGATLTLRGRHKGSLPMLDREDVEQSNDGYSYDGRGKAEQWQKNQNFDPYSTMSSTNPSVNGYQNNANDYNIGYTNASMDSYRPGTRYDNIMSNPHQRLAVAENDGGGDDDDDNDDDDDDDLPPYQEDHLNQKRGGTGSTSGQWNMQPGSTQVKTSTRTYVGPDGSLITEHRTEREGVIETQMRRVQREIQTPDYDYDRALSDAILAVTNVNTDLAVEKIEIQTKEETTQGSYYETDDDDDDDDNLEYAGPGETII